MIYRRGNEGGARGGERREENSRDEGEEERDAHTHICT